MSTIFPIRFKMPYCKKVLSNSPMNDFVDPRFEDDALSALMEEAFSETKDEAKFDIEGYFNGEIDY